MHDIFNETKTQLDKLKTYLRNPLNIDEAISDYYLRDIEKKAGRLQKIAPRKPPILERELRHLFRKISRFEIFVFLVGLVGTMATIVFGVYTIIAEDIKQRQKEQVVAEKRLEEQFFRLSEASRITTEASRQILNANISTTEIISILTKLKDGLDGARKGYAEIKKEFNTFKVEIVKKLADDKDIDAVKDLMLFVYWDAPVDQIRECFISKVFSNKIKSTRIFPIEYYQLAAIFTLFGKQKFPVSNIKDFSDIGKPEYLQIINNIPDWYNLEREILLKMQASVRLNGDQIPENLIYYSEYTDDPYYKGRKLSRTNPSLSKTSILLDIENHLLDYPRDMVD
jgi:hypothetical protein